MHLIHIVRRYPLLTFFSLTFLCTWACWIPFAVSGVVQHPTYSSPLLLLQPLGNSMPALVALLLTGLLGGKKSVKELLGRLGKGRVKPFWYAVALLLVPGIMLLARSIYQMEGGKVPTYQWLELLPTFLLYFVVAGLGEEPGWRGFALPRLQDRSQPMEASLRLGLIWGIWHLPVVIASSGTLTPLFLINFTLFVLIMLAFSVMMTWIYNQSDGSLFLTVLFHATITTSLNSFLVAIHDMRLSLIVLFFLWVVIGLVAWLKPTFAQQALLA